MKELSRERLVRAVRAIEAARREAAAGATEFAAGHAYYAMFYAAEAVLADRDLGYSKHAAVHGAFGKEFAKTGVLDPKYHGWLLKAFKTRQDATYGVGVDITDSEAAEMTRRAEEFVAEVRRYLEGLD